MTLDPVDAIIASNASTHVGAIALIDAPNLVDEARSHTNDTRSWNDADGEPLSTDLVEGVSEVWLRLPRALGALDEYAEFISMHARPGIRLVAAARQKYLSRSMNDVLARHFETVHASLGAQKSRALLAHGAMPSTTSWPRSTLLDDPALGEPLRVWYHGATFSAGKLDQGTSLLAQHLDLVADADDYCDLACGSGIIAACLARRHPEARVTASDAYWSAIDAAQRTCAELGNVTVTRGDGLQRFGDATLDVICCNPPFHIGGAKESSVATRFFRQAARVLRPGGEFWCVYNSHLPWQRHLDRLGETIRIAQDRGYTLTRTRRA